MFCPTTLFRNARLIDIESQHPTTNQVRKFGYLPKIFTLKLILRNCHQAFWALLNMKKNHQPFSCQIHLEDHLEVLSGFLLCLLLSLLLLCLLPFPPVSVYLVCVCVGGSSAGSALLCRQSPCAPATHSCNQDRVHVRHSLT